jgi:hypothetical protein
MFRLAVVSTVVLGLLAAPAAQASPSVSIVSSAPLQLRGVAFKPSIMVTVAVATTDGRLVKRVRTTATGRFVARFAVAVGACNGATAATISTSSGYRLGLRLAPRGVCPPIQPIDQ